RKSCCMCYRLIRALPMPRMAGIASAKANKGNKGNRSPNLTRENFENRGAHMQVGALLTVDAIDHAIGGADRICRGDGRQGICCQRDVSNCVYREKWPAGQFSPP